MVDILSTMKHDPSSCPACGGVEGDAADLSPAHYLRCRSCRSIFSPGLLSTPLTAEEWSAIPRPEPSKRDARSLLRPFGGAASVALAGRADADLMRCFLSRDLPIEACDASRPHWANAAKASLPVKFGTPSQGMLGERHDLVVVEGLLEYSSSPLDELIAVRKALFPDGRARIEAPSADGFLLHRFGSRFALFAPPAVRTLYTFDGLSRLCARAGFRQVSLVAASARAAAWLRASHTYASAYDKLVALLDDRYGRHPSILVATARADAVSSRA